jgi:hypothetical protein
VVAVALEEDADDCAGHDQLLNKSKTLAYTESALYAAQRSKCLCSAPN